MIAAPRRSKIDSTGFSRQVHALLATLLLVMTLALGGFTPISATAAENPTGLPLPRFATTRSTPINVRVGPGTKYDVAWVYVKAGVPVEIIQEYDTWRKIRDEDGSEGWVHQNLLSGNRAGYVAPWMSGEPFALRARAGEDAGVRAWLSPGFRIELLGCDGAWCVVNAIDHPVNGRTAIYSGYLAQADIWGVYEGEAFD